MHSFTSNFTLSPIQTSFSPVSSDSSSGKSSIGSLSLVSPIRSPVVIRPEAERRPASGSSSQDESNPHAFRRPGPTDARCPCPALNTLANHGYLPRDGKNISMRKVIEALTHPDTFNLSHELARVLGDGGAILTEHSLQKLLPILFIGKPISLHDLSLHGGIEHDASIVHKDADGQEYAPTDTDIVLLNQFLGNKQAIELADVARRRVELEKISALNGLYAEIARGEWALVLDIFGRAHGGKIPVDLLRTWLYENRFPDGWRPDHEQGLIETVEMSSRIRHAMADLREEEKRKEVA